MKKLVFDTSSIISLVTNDLLWLLSPLKGNFDREFLIPSSVKFELVDKPLNSHKFKLEAIMISKIISDSILSVHEPLNVDDLLIHINSIYSIDGRPLHIVDKAEVEAFALVLKLQADAYVVDERTMRMIIEDPIGLKKILSNKLRRRIGIDTKLLKEFKEIVKGIQIIRSTELVSIAYEMGLLDKFIIGDNTSKDLVEGFLWGLRLRGCAISTEEIEEIIKLETR